MLLLKDISRTEARSTKELSVDELSLLRAELESSKAVAEADRGSRPNRGGIMYPFVSLVLLAIWKEIKNQTYKGVLKNLDNHDLICLGHKRKPSVGTLFHFVTRMLPKFCDSIGDELSEAVLKAMDDRFFTIDSTPLEAERYNFDAKFNPYYEIRMDKSHILMISGFPLKQIHTDGLTGDCPRARMLVDMMKGMGYDRREGDVLLTDGAYDNFVLYADVWIATGTVMACNHAVNARFHADVDDVGILKEFNSLHDVPGYDPEMKHDVDEVLRFLCKNGKKEVVGIYLRNISMLNSEEYDGKDTRRQVCESAHRAFKRWMSFDIRGLKKVTRKVRIKCRFLFLQLLSTLFKGNVLIES